jgi:tyrosyl-tRNA synthetase
MPILEGLDGVQKMSKSYGNAIGIQETPLEMYGKVMSISDAMMWRYYELLTDVKVPEIEKMKADVASGQAHPMALKKELGRTIVADFHSPDAAAKAGEDWAKQFQKDEVPENLEQIDVTMSAIQMAETADVAAAQNIDASDGERFFVRADKLLKEAGLAASTSEAGRKIKEKAVSINGHVLTGLAIVVSGKKPLTVRVGRKIKLVSLA